MRGKMQGIEGREVQYSEKLCEMVAGPTTSRKVERNHTLEVYFSAKGTGCTDSTYALLLVL